MTVVNNSGILVVGFFGEGDTIRGVQIRAGAV